jgi:simple sugar transport system substrate-binding protein
MKQVIALAALSAAVSLGVSGAFAQSGTLQQAVGGYSFE